jgi:NTP pyrophosphatase (non-canonical NTP hydrolase)
MKKINHSDMVKALVKSGEQIKEEITGSDVNMIHMVMGISGEAGELLDAVKKATVYRKELDRVNIIEELGDLEFYMEGLRQELGITRGETLEENIKKLGKRYEGFKYSNQAAINRADK